MSHPRLVTYAALSTAGLFGAVALGRPDVAVLVVPFAIVLVAGLVDTRRIDVDVTLDLDRDRLVEGDDVALTLSLCSTVAGRADVEIRAPAGTDVVDGDASFALRLRTGERHTRTLRLRPLRWGVHAPPSATVRLTARGGLLVHTATREGDRYLRVHPRTERLRTLLRPVAVQAYTGSHASRGRGEGIEFADIRPFVAGDRVRSVNWRASARRGELWINDRHPERNTDVVLFLDTFAEVGPPGSSTLDDTVRAAATLAARHLAVADRVGLVGLGGVLRWLRAGMGVGQLHAIVDALLATHVVFSYAEKGFDVLPPRSLPPHALVIALTPLLDPRGVATLLDIRARGYDLAVVEWDAEAFVPAGGDDVAAIARRLWAMERASVRDRFAALGVPVARWRGDLSLEELTREVSRFRRSPRLVR